MEHPQPMAGRHMQIVALATARDRLDRLSAWHGAAWAHLYAGWNAVEARADFARERGDGAPPFTLLALENNELLGSVSLVEDDLPGWKSTDPWLGSFLVAPHQRSRGVGAALMRAMLAHADGRGWPQLLLFTEARQAYFARFGFNAIGTHVAGGYPVTVMARSKFA